MSLELDETQEVKASVILSPATLASKRQLAARALEFAKLVAIGSPAECRAAEEVRDRCHAEWTAGEEMRKEAGREFLEAKRQIDAGFDYLKELEEAKKTLSDAVGTYKAQELERHTQALRAAANAHVAGDLTLAAQATATASEASAAGDKGLKVEWVATVTDPASVPRDWCVPDESRIQAMAKATPSTATPIHIPGVVYTQKATTKARPVRKPRP